MCVSEQDMVNTTPSNDGKTLTLKMRDGRILVNHLRGICRDMRFTGFSWVLHGSHDICENQTTLQVLQSGQICILGRFDQPQVAVPPLDRRSSSRAFVGMIFVIAPYPTAAPGI
jgi:hypothetical protein